jgi:valyl-tRNA synthetase
MEISKTYDPVQIENKWYRAWLEKGFFRSVPDDREPYTIVIPPPNVTGVLHMGHMLNNTIQDVLIRRARMSGKNACWVPGTDHASIATEAKVVAMLKEKGIQKRDLSREEFLKYAWEWKEKYGGIILEQLKKLGASCDWDRTRFTMEDDLSDAVIEVFIDLYKKGLIYRGTRMVNWDPSGLTAVSDEEVIYKEVDSTLYYVRYQIENSDEHLVIATTRPETILGDTAICVHPDDARYLHLHGKKAIVPVVNRPVPVITDTYVTMEFGTGALKVTPAHDVNDYQLGQKHRLPMIDVLTPEGKMSEAANFYIGEDRFAVRKKIAADLQSSGHLLKTEPYKSNVGFSERTNAVIEPRLSLQWFLKMDQISKPALENVMNDTIRLVPDKFKNTYRHWMENVHDWCISRQLWWGQRIPAWYTESGEFVVAKTESEAISAFEKLNAERKAKGESPVTFKQLHQDEDVLDTWFSSWLWPISVFDGFKDPNNRDINYYYPTNDLVTAPEILFFWVARMIIAGYEYRGEKPFTNVYLTGIVRDKIGRKMSKSLGNSPDPLDLIAKYGADGVRVGMLLCSPAGNDLPFDESLCEQGRNFANKIWNAFRLIQGWKENASNGNVDTRDYSEAVKWFQSKMSSELANINDLFEKYRISEALMSIYKLVWDDFCSWYLELVKPGMGQSMQPDLIHQTINFFEDLLRILHPFMPFITEELWHTLQSRSEKDYLIVASMPKPLAADTEILKQFEAAADLISQIRNLRKSKNISMKESIEVTFLKGRDTGHEKYHSLIMKLCNLSSIAETTSKPTGVASLMAKEHEYFIHTGSFINKDAERVRINQELDYTKSFLESVEKKLTNERFISNAKAEVIALEKKKQSDAEARIRLLTEQLEALKN